MKKLIVILLSISLLSCSTENFDSPKKKSIKLSEHTEEIDALRKDITDKYNSLSLNQKLELCVQVYSFEYPHSYKAIMENVEFSVDYLLFKDPKFIKLCKKRNVDLSNIPDNYFSKNGTPVEYVDVHLLNNIKTEKKKLISKEDYINEGFDKNKDWELIRTIQAIKSK